MARWSLKYPTARWKDLSRLAHKYIMRSDGNIKAVIWLDIEYQGTQTASFSVWQLEIKVSEEDGQNELTATQTVIDKVKHLTILFEFQLRTLLFRYFAWRVNLYL